MRKIFLKHELLRRSQETGGPPHPYRDRHAEVVLRNPSLVMPMPSAPHPPSPLSGCGAEGREDSKCVQKLTKNNKNHQKVSKNLQKQQKPPKSAKKSPKKSACELVRGKPTNFYEILCKLKVCQSQVSKLTMPPKTEGGYSEKK